MGKREYKKNVNGTVNDILLDTVNNGESYDSFKEYSKDMMDFTSSNVF